MGHDAKRRQVALHSYEKTLKEHTFSERIRKLLQIIRMRKWGDWMAGLTHRSRQRKRNGRLARHPRRHPHQKRNRHHFTLGKKHGYFHGRCAAIVQQYFSDDEPIRPLKIIFAKTGKGPPYIFIDESTIEAFHGLVEHLWVVSQAEDVAALAHAVRPDAVLYLDSTGSIPPEQIAAIRSMGIKTAVWFTDDPYYTDVTVQSALHFDYVFTLDQGVIPLYQSHGCHEVHHLPLGMNPQMYTPQKVDLSYRSDICFIGSAFWNRVALFDGLAPYLAEKKVVIAGWWWDRLQHYALLQNQIHLGEWMTPEKTAKYYFGAKIVINLHRQYDDESYNMNSLKIPALSVNPRTFEICGSGAFQLTDIREDLPIHYSPGHDIATYESPEELLEKLVYYLHHEKERESIALNGLKRTMQEHTYRRRLSRMLQMMFM